MIIPASSAPDRNNGPILEVLQQVLPPRASVLEIASGTGQHAAHFAAAQPGWRWQAIGTVQSRARAATSWLLSAGPSAGPSA